MNSITNNNFKSPVIGHDPVSGGTFIIQYAYMIWDDSAEDDFTLSLSQAQGKIVITPENDNPLYKIAKEEPLRLQGLIASVQFGVEKRFIKIKSIQNYMKCIDINLNEYAIELNPVTFEILDNLEYLENIEEYKDWNLL